jgi:hypothetical protein
MAADPESEKLCGIQFFSSIFSKIANVLLTDYDFQSKFHFCSSPNPSSAALEDETDGR